MKAVFKKLDAPDWNSLHDFFVGIYLDGCCYEFAVALHRALGWPLVGVIHKEIIRHAVVKDPDGNFWDARGKVMPGEVGKPFSITDYQLCPITEEDLVKVRPLNKMGIDRALLMAETLWPEELPWKETAFRSKVLAFVEELDELCKKHEVWLRATLHTAPIIIDKMIGDEEFVVQPSTIGNYFLDRNLKQQ